MPPLCKGLPEILQLFYNRHIIVITYFHDLIHFCALPIKMNNDNCFRQTIAKANVFSKAFLSATGDIFHVSGSESINKGLAHWYKIGLALATKVKLEQNTNSLGLLPIVLMPYEEQQYLNSFAPA